MKLLSSKPEEPNRGIHACQLCIESPGLVKSDTCNGVAIDPNCSWARCIAERSSNGEIRVSGEGIVFAAPVLIVHYIEAHSYLPPAQFLKAIDDALS